MMSTIEQEITNGILLFAKERNINLSAREIANIKEKTTHRRRIVLHKDTFLLTCQYLTFYEIINFITTSKEFMKHYPFIWNIIQKKIFPNSIFISTDYKVIRYNIVIDRWYNILYQQSNGDFDIYYESLKCILSDDTIIESRYNNIKETYNSKVTRTHRAEINATKKTRASSVNRLPDNLMHMINLFSHYRENDPDGDKYILIKSEVDMRLYGLDPSSEEDMDEWTNIGIKWVNGEFNTNKIKIDMHEYNTDSSFGYGIDDEVGFFKFRILPVYFDY
jgi:hypothetical protein